jgi:hypothetical protein
MRRGPSHVRVRFGVMIVPGIFHSAPNVSRAAHSGRARIVQSLTSRFVWQCAQSTTADVRYVPRWSGVAPGSAPSWRVAAGAGGGGERSAEAVVWERKRARGGRGAFALVRRHAGSDKDTAQGAEARAMEKKRSKATTARKATGAVREPRRDRSLDAARDARPESDRRAARRADLSDDSESAVRVKWKAAVLRLCRSSDGSSRSRRTTSR